MDVTGKRIKNIIIAFIADNIFTNGIKAVTFATATA